MKKKKFFVLLLTVSMLLTAGCSKKVEEIKTVDETQTDAAQPSETKDDLAQFRDAKVWNDDLQGTYKGEKVDISFFAQVEIPACTQSVVVEGKFLEFDEEYKKIVLEKIADGEDIYYYDIAHRTTEELEQKLEELGWKSESYEQFVENSEDRFSQWDGHFDEDYLLTEKEMRDMIKKIPEYLATSSDEYTKATDFYADEYIIKRNGGWCKIYFIRQETGNQTIYMRGGKDNGPGEIWKDALAVSCIIATSRKVDDDDENECKYSPEEAGQVAISFAQKVGFDGLVSVDGDAWNLFTSPHYENRDCVWGIELGEGRCYGYAIAMSTGINGEPMFGTVNEEGMTGKAKVMDDGVFSFYINNPMEQTRVSEHVALLSLDKIKEAFKKEVTQNLDLYCSTNRKKFKFDTLKFLYLWQMKDDATGEGAYIPVWVLKDATMEPEIKIYVNAIDGTVLDKENLR